MHPTVSTESRPPLIDLSIVDCNRPHRLLCAITLILYAPSNPHRKSSHQDATLQLPAVTFSPCNITHGTRPPQPFLKNFVHNGQITAVCVSAEITACPKTLNCFGTEPPFFRNLRVSRCICPAARFRSCDTYVLSRDLQP